VVVVDVVTPWAITVNDVTPTLQRLVCWHVQGVALKVARGKLFHCSQVQHQQRTLLPALPAATTTTAPAARGTATLGLVTLVEFHKIFH
jgi:hypothetical protein